MTDRDDIDPADWLAQQFGAPEPEPEPVAPAPVPASAPAPAPVSAAETAPAPVAPAPVAPVPPPYIEPAASAPLFVSPEIPPPSSLPLPDSASPAAEAPEKRTAGGGFQWGLTPSGEADAPPPVIAPTPSYDLPTQAMPQLPGQPPAQQPGPPTQQPGQALESQPFDVTRWLAAPVDSSIEGVTEVIEAELVGLATPEAEGAPASAIDNLFGDAKFQDYENQPLISGPPPREATPPRGPRPPMPRVQKVLLWVAGSLVAALALVALFLVGTKLSDTLGAPAAIETPTPTPTPISTVLPVGPVAAGEHQWDALLGGECLAPWQSAWQDSYTVVDCATPHPAQMIFRGTFDDAPGTPYPGIEELQKRINLLCTPTTVIDYSKAGMLNDIQVSASFAAADQDWADGNRTFFCFVNRSSGQDLTESVAVAQAAPAA